MDPEGGASDTPIPVRAEAGPLSVAVTGASGFVGRQTVKRLRAAGHAVRVLSHRTPVRAIDGVEVVAGGLDDASALDRLVAGAGAVVHLAGLVAAARPADFDTVNAGGTARLADRAEAAGVGRFLYVSSLAAREPGLSAYGASKRAGEAGLAGRPGLPCDVLRPPAVYGPGDRHALVLLRLLKRRIALLPAPEEARVALIHVDDLAGAILAWLHGPRPQGATFEITDGARDGYGWREVIDTAARALSVRPVHVRPPRAVLTAAGLIARGGARLIGRPPFLSPDKVRELRHPDWRADAGPFRHRTGWRPEIGLASGFSRTVRWYRAAGWL